MITAESTVRPRAIEIRKGSKENGRPYLYVYLRANPRSVRRTGPDGEAFHLWEYDELHIRFPIPKALVSKIKESISQLRPTEEAQNNFRQKLRQLLAKEADKYQAALENATIERVDHRDNTVSITNTNKTRALLFLASPAMWQSDIAPTMP